MEFAPEVVDDFQIPDGPEEPLPEVLLDKALQIDERAASGGLQKSEEGADEGF